MKKILLATLLFSAGCGGGYLRNPARAGDTNVRLVTAIWVNPRPGVWQSSGWYRYERDMLTPARVIVAGDWACALQTPEVFEPRPDEFYVCRGDWRFRRVA